jgi:tRNA threonylcarbamoyl adenosine modification protein (Sua5/YciO/YrdC/YwlC family)
MTDVTGVPDGDGDDETVERFRTSEETEREAGIANAALAVQRGQLVVLPTDTVYGVGADAFDPAAVRRLLAAKGRGREMPPPVLVSAATTLDALAVGVPSYARTLISELWPGPLTLVCRQQPSLQWDLGDTRGTVAVRMPDHEVALELLSRTGPLAVSSANRSGMPAAQDADAAEAMLGSSVRIILDAGPTPGAEPSTIVDVTGSRGRVLRVGAVPLARLNEIVAPLGVDITDEG